MRDRFSLALLMSAALCAVAPPGALAATEIGQACAPGGLATDALVQASTTPAVGSYAVPAGGGVITAWKIQGPPALPPPDTYYKLKVFRPTPDPLSFFVVGDSKFERITATGVLSFGTRIPVAAGDVLGAKGIPGSLGCTVAPGSGVLRGFGDNSDPPEGTTASAHPAHVSSDVIVDMAATVEPDGDRDGFGDETQDQCPTDPSTQAACPVAAKDTQAPLLALDLSTVQRLKRSGIKVVVQSDEQATADLSGALSVPRVRASKSFKLKRVTSTLKARTKKTLRLRFSRKAYRSAKRALRKGKRVRARLTTKLVDAAGNAATEKRTVLLRR